MTMLIESNPPVLIHDSDMKSMLTKLPLFYVVDIRHRQWYYTSMSTTTQ